MLKINQIVQLARDMQPEIEFKGQKHIIQCPKGWYGYIKETNNGAYIVKLISHGGRPEITCAEEDLIPREYHEVIGVVEDIDYMNFYIDSFSIGLYEGKKIRLRVEIIE